MNSPTYLTCLHFSLSSGKIILYDSTIFIVIRNLKIISNSIRGNKTFLQLQRLGKFGVLIRTYQLMPWCLSTCGAICVQQNSEKLEWIVQNPAAIGLNRLAWLRTF